MIDFNIAYTILQIQPNRELLRQGDLVVKLGTESQELATILFSDILLFAKSSKNKNEKWKYKGAIGKIFLLFFYNVAIPQICVRLALMC